MVENPPRESLASVKLDLDLHRLPGREYFSAADSLRFACCFDAVFSVRIEPSAILLGYM